MHALPFRVLLQRVLRHQQQLLHPLHHRELRTRGRGHDVPLLRRRLHRLRGGLNELQRVCGGIVPRRGRPRFGLSAVPQWLLRGQPRLFFLFSLRRRILQQRAWLPVVQRLPAEHVPQWRRHDDNLPKLLVRRSDDECGCNCLHSVHRSLPVRRWDLLREWSWPAMSAGLLLPWRRPAAVSFRNVGRDKFARYTGLLWILPRWLLRKRVGRNEPGRRVLSLRTRDHSQLCRRIHVLFL